MSWSEERVARLKQLWLEGQSASQIAKELGGVTRNAVIGKVHRLGLSNRASGAETAAQAKPKPKRKTTSKKVEPELVQPNTETKPDAPTPSVQTQVATNRHIIPAEKPLPPQPAANEISPEVLASHREVQKKALRLSLMQLTEKTCKWPFGDPATDDFWFCGLPVEPGKCYCKPCAELAYQPASARRDRKR